MTKARSSALGVLTGIVMSGVCAANAATITTTDSFALAAPAHDSDFAFLLFPLFPPSLGTLTGVDWFLSSTLTPSTDRVVAIVSREVSFFSPFLRPRLFDLSRSPFPFFPDHVLHVSGLPADYTGSGEIGIFVDLNNLSDSPASWTANGPDQGLTLTYTFSPKRRFTSVADPTSLPAATPLPAALPLFATGLGALGLLGWRRKRKAHAPR